MKYPTYRMSHSSTSRMFHASLRALLGRRIPTPFGATKLPVESVGTCGFRMAPFRWLSRGLVESLLLMPFVPSSFLLLVVRPGALLVASWLLIARNLEFLGSVLGSLSACLVNHQSTAPTPPLHSQGAAWCGWDVA